MSDDTQTEELKAKVAEFLAAHPVDSTDPLEFNRARYDAGLAWVHYPEGRGGLGLPRSLSTMVDGLFDQAGAPDHNRAANTIGLGMAAPTLLAYASDDVLDELMRPLWTGENVWCQLFSEPGAGSDLAGLSTRAIRDGDDWVVNGQKVWTSNAHLAKYAILVARTNPDVPKHQGLSYFIVDMTDPGVEVRPLRQITGEAEFNEVFLTNVRIPDRHRLGDEGEGWRVANTTLNNERVAIGGMVFPREGGLLGPVAKAWREHPELRTPELHERLMKLWVEQEVLRLMSTRLRQKLAVGAPGPEGSAVKLIMATVNQQVTGLEVELLGGDGLRYADWTLKRPSGTDWGSRTAGFKYLRMKGNSIEGGTSEILRNVVSERVLGLPGEHRVDKDAAWKDLAK